MRNIWILIAISLCLSCSQETKEKPINDVEESSFGDQQNTNKGGLIIIGGGKRPQSLLKRIIKESGIDKKGYGMVLPMSSIEPDSANWYAIRQFEELGYTNIFGLDYDSINGYRQRQIDSLKGASLIYISGGDQRKFMDRISGTSIGNIIRERYASGSIIAGTSAGAAVQSRRMITGDERKHPEYHPTYRHLETENFDWTEGLALVDGVIIDQHFVKRSRYNRLLTAIMTFPDEIGAGIDESTAMYIRGDSVEVLGESQVIIFKNTARESNQKDGKLGSKGITLDIYLPGEKFPLK
ncbi:cyanophycinase [Marinigracilibium pacificum]|uniref:Cyanophycinase n=1 Tax=Marinigracilibium pacificum TaxID=2729599 RepID=A0A848J368_9BACT|nr:cyanophycinase [Marinigracilibium pacificum]NMM48934.1 cyanophycinase [Marinigracilibium pacificum]